MIKLLRFYFDFLTPRFGGGGGSQRVIQETTIPDFLQPFLRQSAVTSSRALGGLEDMLVGSGGGLNLPPGARIENGRVVRDVQVSPGIGGGFGGGGFQDSVTIGGRTIPRRGLTSQIGQGGGTQTIDLGALSDFRRAPTGQPDLVAGFDPLEEQAMGLAEQRALGEGGFIPTFQDQLLGISQGRGLESLLPESAFQSLNQTASGDFLHGGQGFNEALEAAERRIMPNVMNRFASAGQGTGGLAQIGATQALGDSFAGLFNQERARQLGAAGALGDLQNAELSRQMAALGQLPGAATIDADMLSQIGGNRRGMAQREITAPIAALESLIAAGQGGPGSFSSMFGQSETTPMHTDPLGSVIGGGMAGASLMTGPVGYGLANLGLTSGAMLPWGAMAGPVGALAGAGLGLLMS